MSCAFPASLFTTHYYVNYATTKRAPVARTRTKQTEKGAKKGGGGDVIQADVEGFPVSRSRVIERLHTKCRPRKCTEHAPKRIRPDPPKDQSFTFSSESGHAEWVVRGVSNSFPSNAHAVDKVQKNPRAHQKKIDG